MNLRMTLDEPFFFIDYTMKIALYAPDSKMPNFALMKISKFHKSKKDIVDWHAPIFTFDHDIVYCSKIFTYTKKPFIPNENIIKGGTGYDIKSTLPDEIEKCEPDYTIYPEFKHALGFITRGCIRKCDYCIVPEKEGKLQPYRDIEQILQGRNTVILMDNNVLASDYGIKQIEKIIKLKIKVDFNQGLDARLIDNSIARLLAKVKWLEPLRLSCDNIFMIEPVRKAVELLRWNNCVPVRYFVYMIVKDIEDALERVKFLKGMHLSPFAQPYRDREGTEPSQIQKDFSRWVNRKWIFKSIPWENYKNESNKAVLK